MLIVTKQNDYQVQSGARITCAKFGSVNYQLMAAGDDQKNVYLWKLNKTLPKMVLSGHQTGVSELSFCARADFIFSGTVGGTVHMWDIAKRTDTVKLLGH
jgi:WD40 repeat protein